MNSYGKARYIPLKTRLGRIIQDEPMMATEMMTPFVSPQWQRLEDPQDDIATNYDLDTVRMDEIRETGAELYAGTQRSLAARGLGATFKVYRYGDVRGVVSDVTAVTLSPYVARAGRRRTKQKAHVYECRRDAVLLDVEAFWPSGQRLEEEELLVNPKGLTRGAIHESIETDNALDAALSMVAKTFDVEVDHFAHGDAGAVFPSDFIEVRGDYGDGKPTIKIITEKPGERIRAFRLGKHGAMPTRRILAAVRGQLAKLDEALGESEMSPTWLVLIKHAKDNLDKVPKPLANSIKWALEHRHTELVNNGTTMWKPKAPWLWGVWKQAKEMGTPNRDDGYVVKTMAGTLIIGPPLVKGRPFKMVYQLGGGQYKDLIARGVLDGKTGRLKESAVPFDLDTFDALNEVQDDWLFHTTHIHLGRAIANSRKLFPGRGASAHAKNRFVSLSERPAPSFGKMILVFRKRSIKNRLIKIDYTRDWFIKHPDHADYVGGTQPPDREDVVDRLMSQASGDVRFYTGKIRRVREMKEVREGRLTRAKSTGQKNLARTLRRLLKKDGERIRETEKKLADATRMQKGVTDKDIDAYIKDKIQDGFEEFYDYKVEREWIVKKRDTEMPFRKGELVAVLCHNCPDNSTKVRDLRQDFEELLPPRYVVGHKTGMKRIRHRAQLEPLAPGHRDPTPSELLKTYGRYGAIKKKRKAPRSASAYGLGASVNKMPRGIMLSEAGSDARIRELERQVVLNPGVRKFADDLRIAQRRAGIVPEGEEKYTDIIGIARKRTRQAAKLLDRASRQASELTHNSADYEESMAKKLARAARKANLGLSRMAKKPEAFGSYFYSNHPRKSGWTLPSDHARSLTAAADLVNQAARDLRTVSNGIETSRGKSAADKWWAATGWLQAFSGDISSLADPYGGHHMSFQWQKKFGSR